MEAPLPKPAGQQELAAQWAAIEELGGLYQELDTRVRALEDARRPAETSKKRQRVGSDGSADRETLTFDDRYSYLDPEVKKAAMSGTLMPAQVPLLISDWSLLWSGTDRRGYIEMFIDRIPDSATFLYAWSIYVELAAHDQPDPGEIYEPMMWYGRWIAEHAATHTWESLCRYHLAFHLDRCKRLEPWRWRTADIDKLTGLVRLPKTPEALDPVQHHGRTGRRRGGGRRR